MKSSPFVGISGNVFDYEILSNHVADAVFVKGGNIGGNLYNNENPTDGDPAGAGGPLKSDGNLHSPLQRNNITTFGGLSHISFCFSEAPAELEIEKTPDGGTISPGDNAVFTITVTSVGQSTANNVVIDDELPAGFTWSEDPDTAECSITSGTTLHCDVGDLAPMSSFSVTVSAPTTRDDCGLIDNPAAEADADNADMVTDSGDITVECGAIQIQKDAKHKGTDTSPDLEATFEIKDSSGTVVETVTTDSTTGLACVDGLAFDTYDVDETDAATGYKQDPDVESVTVDTEATCDDDPFVGGTVSFTNVPLTDVTITIDSLVKGATETVITCRDEQGNVVFSETASADSDEFGDDELVMSGLEPRTLDCEIVIDP